MSDITGQKFGQLTVLSRDYSFKHPKHTKWICQCECGNIKSIFRNSLISGRSKSCGCQMYKGKKGINETHGMSKTRIYHEWASMKRRCLPNTPDSKQYYNRGITVCDEWRNDFMSFYNWSIKNGYDDSLTIDRIDNNKGYSPQNCRWIPIEQQQSNKTNTIHITYKNKQYCLRTLCGKIGFPYKTAYKRLQRMKARGESVDVDKLFAPIQKDKIAFRYRK